MGDPRFRNLEIKVGLFILIALIGLVVIIAAVGVSRDIFVKKIYINVYADTGDDLSKGMPVKYSGFAISRVDTLGLQDDGQVVMRIGIPTRYAKWIREDSIIKLGAQNIIGSNFISIQTDLQSVAPVIRGEDRFVLVRDQGLQAIIDKAMPVVEDLKEIVSNFNTIVGRVADENGDVNRLLHGLGALGDDINNKEGSLSFIARSDYIQNEIIAFLKDLRDFSSTAVKVADNVEKGSLTLNNALTKIDDHSNPILDETMATVKQIETTVKSLEPLIERLGEIAKSADQIAKNAETVSKNVADGTENLDTLRDEIQSIVETGNELLLKLENTWPLSIGDKAPKKVPLQ